MKLSSLPFPKALIWVVVYLQKPPSDAWFRLVNVGVLVCWFLANGSSTNYIKKVGLWMYPCSLVWKINTENLTSDDCDQQIKKNMNMDFCWANYSDLI